MKRKRYLKLFLIFLYVCCAAFIYWCLYEKPIIGIDDANIYFVYMRNLADGYGFVYNAGGERVEGFSSLLWTLIGSIFFTHSNSPEILLLLLNIFLLTFAFWRLVLLMDDLFEDSRLVSPISFFILGSVIIIPGYYDWTILTLMETGLWSCLLIVTIVILCDFELNKYSIKQNNLMLSLLLILLVLTRPESYLWGSVFLIIRFWQLLRVNKKRILSSAIHIILPFTCFFVAVIALTEWRLNYFGFLFPNTYYAKVSVDYIGNVLQGIMYDIHFVKQNFFSLVILFFAVFYIRDIIKSKIFDKKTYVFIIITISIVVSFFIPLFTAGDHFNLSRFIQPTIPLFYVLFAIAAAKYYSIRKNNIKIYSEILILLFFIFFTPYYNLIGYKIDELGINNEFGLAEKGRVTGSKLTEFFYNCNPYPSHGTFASGGQAFSYKGNSIDLMGLNNTEMAHANPLKMGLKNHASFDKAIFYKLSPEISFIADFIQDTTNAESRLIKEGWFNETWLEFTFKGIFKEEKFQQYYSPVFIFKKGSKSCLHTYASKKFLARLNSNYYSYKTIMR